MNIRTLELFIHLCESRNFSHTAHSMHISPSALSRVIQRLEEDVGKTLFIRDNRSVELTAAGKTLLPTAVLIISRWHDTKAELDDHNQQLKGRLRLFCSVTASYSYLSNIISQFRLHHPQVDIELITGDPALATSQVQQDIADIAIAAKPAQLSSKLNFLKLDDIPLSVIAPLIPPPALRKYMGEIPVWNALPFILPESGAAREKADQWLRQHKIKPHIYAQVAGHEAIVSMVALGCGVGIAPDIVIENSPLGGKIQKLEHSAIMPLELGLCWKQSKHNDPLVQALLGLLPKRTV